MIRAVRRAGAGEHGGVTGSSRAGFVGDRDGRIVAPCGSARFAVSIASVVRWKQRVDETGETGPRPTGGDQRSVRIEAHKAYLLGLVRREPDLTLEEIRAKLQDRGERFATSVIARFFVRHGITFKKNRACERAGSVGREGAPPGVVRRPTLT